MPERGMESARQPLTWPMRRHTGAVECQRSALRTVAQRSRQRDQDIEDSFARHKKLWVPEKGGLRKDEGRTDQADVHGRQGWETISVTLVEQTVEKAFPGCRGTVGCYSWSDLRLREQSQLWHLQRRPHGFVHGRRRRRSYAKQMRESVQGKVVHLTLKCSHP